MYAGIHGNHTWYWKCSYLLFHVLGDHEVRGAWLARSNKVICREPIVAGCSTQDHNDKSQKE
jgi:hypothetical protein